MVYQHERSYLLHVFFTCSVFTRSSRPFTLSFHFNHGSGSHELLGLSAASGPSKLSIAGGSRPDKSYFCSGLKDRQGIANTGATQSFTVLV